MKAGEVELTVQERWGARHRKVRERLNPLVLAGRVSCSRCGQPILPGEPWDLGHVDSDPSQYAGPEHRSCNRATSGRKPWVPPAIVVPEPERDGLEASDPAWRVPWLEELSRVPRNATWPRLMTIPHPRATDSL